MFVFPLVVSDELGFLLGGLLLLLFVVLFIYAIKEELSTKKTVGKQTHQRGTSEREKRIEQVRFLRDKYPQTYSEWFGDGSYLAGLSDEEIETRLSISSEIWQAEEEAFYAKQRVENEEHVRKILEQQEKEDKEQQIVGRATELCNLYPNAIRKRLGYAKVITLENAEAILELPLSLLPVEESNLLEERKQRLDEIKRKNNYYQCTYPRAYELIRRMREDGELVDDIYLERERQYSNRKVHTFPAMYAALPESVYQKYESLCFEYSSNEEWYQKQVDFSDRVLRQKQNDYAGWGHYSYIIPFEGHLENGSLKEYTFNVWQIFIDRFCLSDNEDYTYFPKLKEHRKHVLQLKECTGTFNELVYKKVTDFIVSISGTKSVLIADSGLGNNWKSIEPVHFGTLIHSLQNNGIRVSELSVLDSFSCPPNSVIVILELITNNKNLKDNCLKVLLRCKQQQAQIVYLSLEKEFDEDELRSLNERKREEIQREEDRRRREIEVRERKERENQQRVDAERKAKEEQIRREQQILSTLTSRVSQWETLWGGLKISYLFDYFPTNVDFEANEKEWEDRWTVWNFKNDPNKTSESAHQQALNRVIPAFEELLKKTFGSDILKYLTLVCIPASTQEKSERRYREFSDCLCHNTGMTNAFPYIQVTRNKSAKHEGGEKASDNYSFNDSYFNGKRVILLDDIITSGNSMNTAKAKLEQYGAKVICGISVGKTRHERR